MRDEVIPRKPGGVHEGGVHDLVVEGDRGEIDLDPRQEDLVNLVVEVGAGVEHGLLAQGTDVGELGDLEAQFLARLANGRVFRGFAGADVTGDGDIPLAGPVFFGERAPLEEQSAVRRDDPEMRRAVPRAGAVGLGFVDGRAGGVALRGENVERFDAFSLSPGVSGGPKRHSCNRSVSGIEVSILSGNAIGFAKCSVFPSKLHAPSLHCDCSPTGPPPRARNAFAVASRSAR